MPLPSFPPGNCRATSRIAGVESQFASGSPVAILADNAGQVSGYIPLKDLESSGKYDLRVTVPRTITKTGQANIALFLTSLAGAGVFIILFVLLFVDRIILFRLNAITRTVTGEKIGREYTGPGSHPTGETNSPSSHSRLIRSLPSSPNPGNGWPRARSGTGPLPSQPVILSTSSVRTTPSCTSTPLRHRQWDVPAERSSGSPARPSSAVKKGSASG